MRVIGLLGRAGSGKSTAARYLRDHHGADVTGLAVPLKEMAREIWEFSSDQLYGDAAVKERVDERWNMSPRTVMQRLGQSARQHLGPKVWINGLRLAINASHAQFVVVEDVRYENEAQAFAEAGWSVVKIVNPMRESEADSNHPSEAQVDTAMYDYLVVNKMDLTFFEALDSVMTAVMR